MNNIRNFCIIAHIDHGKSTLADRFLEITKTVAKRDMKHGQMLDTMDLEQERGITIKLQPVRMEYNYKGQKYILNLIDTPGHVDFSYEVSRSLAACEGAILVVDATQGVEAQTLANCYLALEHNLKIIPVLNKIDLEAADVEGRCREIENALLIPKEEIIAVSAKQGINIEEVLERIIEKIDPPEAKKDSCETKALVFDSVYDPYRGVVAYVRLFEGSIATGDIVKFLSTNRKIEVLEVGYFKPKYSPTTRLNAGEVGYVVTGLKKVSDARVGDTIWQDLSNEKGAKFKPSPLPGYKEVTPYVFASVFCTDGSNYPLLRDALEKLSLNDASLNFEPESSSALGHGFRCGFLGLLHMDIVQERLEREYDLDLIVTAPSVSYVVLQKNGKELKISNPTLLPDRAEIEEIKEPWVRAEILTPKGYIGSIMELVKEKRGIHKSMEYLDLDRVTLNYEIPLASVIIDFYDGLKSASCGYASMNYGLLEYRTGDLVKLDILVAGEEIPPLSSIIHRSEAFYFGRSVTKKLKKLIPRSMFEISIQAAIGSKIIARESLSALRKNVTEKLYGGDRTRKDKLLKKQKEGKKRMRKIGKVEIPQEAFLSILKR